MLRIVRFAEYNSKPSGLGLGKFFALAPRHDWLGGDVADLCDHDVNPGIAREIPPETDGFPDTSRCREQRKRHPNASHRLLLGRYRGDVEGTRP